MQHSDSEEDAGVGKKKKKAPDAAKSARADRGPPELSPFGSLDQPRCPLCRHPLVGRMTRKGPGSPCPCQNPEEDFAPLGPNFVMPPGTPGSRQVARLRARGILTN